MPKRSAAQRIGRAAEDRVLQLFDHHPRWLARRQEHDFGIDIEAELATPNQIAEQELLGQLIKIQVKGAERLRSSEDGHKRVSISRRYINYASQFRLPVILVAVELSSQNAWWVWLQHWILNNEVQLHGKKSASVTIPFPERQLVVSGLNAELVDIASGTTPTSLVLALRDLAVTARAANNVEVVKAIFDLLDRVDAPSRSWAFDKTIDSLIGLGSDPAFWRAQQFVPQLIAIVQRVGSSLTQDQVVRLVVRGDTYSRAALYGLAKLYDEWFEHMRLLRLGVKFRSLGIEPLAWYCDFREAHPGRTSLQLWLDAGANRLGGSKFGALKLPDSEVARDRIQASWPNVGDSVFLDILVPG